MRSNEYQGLFSNLYTSLENLKVEFVQKPCLRRIPMKFPTHDQKSDNVQKCQSATCFKKG